MAGARERAGKPAASLHSGAAAARFTDRDTRTTVWQ